MAPQRRGRGRGVAFTGRNRGASGVLLPLGQSQASSSSSMSPVPLHYLLHQLERTLRIQWRLRRCKKGNRLLLFGITMTYLMEKSTRIAFLEHLFFMEKSTRCLPFFVAINLKIMGILR